VISGVDGSPGSDRALAVASDLAGGLGLSVLPVSATHSHEIDEDGGVFQVTAGDPADALSEVASWNRSPMIVVGMRASEVRRRSVSRRLAAKASVPVLIVPPGIPLPRFAPDRTKERAVAPGRRRVQVSSSPSIGTRQKLRAAAESS
jgi:nucleotide-binding universal stress UspA family protein